VLAGVEPPVAAPQGPVACRASKVMAVTAAIPARTANPTTTQRDPDLFLLRTGSGRSRGPLEAGRPCWVVEGGRTRCRPAVGGSRSTVSSSLKAATRCGRSLGCFLRARSIADASLSGTRGLISRKGLGDSVWMRCMLRIWVAIDDSVSKSR